MENKKYYEMSLQELINIRESMDITHPCYHLVCELIECEYAIIKAEEEKETIKMDMIQDTL